MSRLSILTSSLLLGATLCLATGARTQTRAALPRPLSLDFTMRPGETRLEGTIRKVDRAHGQFTLEVDITVAGDNAAGEVLGPGLHVISVDDATSFGNRATGNLELALDNLVVGSDAIIIGTSPAQAQLIQARLVVVSDSAAAHGPSMSQTGLFFNPRRLTHPAPSVLVKSVAQLKPMAPVKPVTHSKPMPARSSRPAHPALVAQPSHHNPTFHQTAAPRLAVVLPAKSTMPPATLTMPATTPKNGYISPPQTTVPAAAPDASGTATPDAHNDTAHATNPLGVTSVGANLSTLEETARQRFQARQIAQNEIHYNYFSGGTPGEKLVALTFDDGPNPAGTPAVLDILKREGVPATFFLIGRNAEKHPELVLRELAEGHDIGNHTYHHRQRTNLSLQEWRDEISQTNAVIVNIVGASTRWFRAPGCHYTAATLQAIQEQGMVRVDTTNNSSDWDKRSAAVISQSVLERLAPGNVLLFHDPMPETARALPHLIHEIRNRGYRFVLLGDLALRAQATPGFQPAFHPLGQGIVIGK